MKIYLCYLNVSTVDTSFCVFDKVIGAFDDLDKAKEEIKNLDINKYLRKELDTVLELKSDFIKKNNQWSIEYGEEQDGYTSATVSIKEIDLNKFSI